ncbi:hypothetical protein [Tabrizicola sp.]|uniref:hypothetical protein n=1 Tax=Tabrizicola sp. TaxID=2005166 RepID=UPI002FDCC77E
MTFEFVRKIKTLRPGKTGAERTVAPACLALMLAASPVGAGILGVDVDVGIGRGGANVGASVGVGGVGATANAGVGGGGVGASANVGAGGVGASANVGVGNTGVGATASVGAGGVGVGVDVGVGTPGTPTTPGTPGVVNPTPTASVTPPGAGGTKSMLCAKDGNATTYNGFVVRDRAGVAVGVVHDATLSSKQKVVAVRMLSNGMACYSLKGATFRVKNGEVWANVDAASFK